MKHGLNFTHRITGATTVINITSDEYTTLNDETVVYDFRLGDVLADRLFVHITDNSDLPEYWYDHYKYEGIF